MSVCQVAYLCCCFGRYLRVANFREDPFHAIGCITLFCRDAQFLVYAPVQTDQERAAGRLATVGYYQVLMYRPTCSRGEFT
jgi:hypothetical protein